MRAFARREYWSDTTKVYVVEDFPCRALTLSRRVGDTLDSFEWIRFDEGTEPPPLFSAKADVMEKIAEALTEFAPKLPATEDALQDARSVRDRLLTLVERGYDA